MALEPKTLDLKPVNSGASSDGARTIYARPYHSSAYGSSRARREDSPDGRRRGARAAGAAQAEATPTRCRGVRVTASIATIVIPARLRFLASPNYFMHPFPYPPLQDLYV